MVSLTCFRKIFQVRWRPPLLRMVSLTFTKLINFAYSLLGKNVQNYATIWLCTSITRSHFVRFSQNSTCWNFIVLCRSELDFTPIRFALLRLRFCQKILSECASECESASANLHLKKNSSCVTPHHSWVSYLPSNSTLHNLWYPYAKVVRNI